MPTTRKTKLLQAARNKEKLNLNRGKIICAQGAAAAPALEEG
jgi:hypothetical protein